ncbi:MAG: hypothetical protein AMXMBFR55_01140 [Gemmatimonadota bacterium]
MPTGSRGEAEAQLLAEPQLLARSMSVDWADEPELPSPSVDAAVASPADGAVDSAVDAAVDGAVDGAVDAADEPRRTSLSATIDRSDEPPTRRDEWGWSEADALGDVAAVENEPRLDAGRSGDGGLVGGGLPDPLPGRAGELEEEAIVDPAYVAPALIPDVASSHTPGEAPGERQVLEVGTGGGRGAAPDTWEASVGQGGAPPQEGERGAPAPVAEAPDEGRERVAELLEQVAERVRRGEIVPVTDANAGPAAVLASVLASLLSASR